MTKDELIAALQADASPGETPVVIRAIVECYYYVVVSRIEPIRRDKITDRYYSGFKPCDGSKLTLTIS